MTDQGSAGPVSLVKPAAAEPIDGSVPGIRIMAQFIRDLSFENPRAPESLRTSAVQPQIDLGVEMSARARPDELYEVDLKLTASAQNNGDPIFTVELLYGGLFQISGIGIGGRGALVGHGGFTSRLSRPEEKARLGG